MHFLSTMQHIPSQMQKSTSHSVEYPTGDGAYTQRDLCSRTLTKKEYVWGGGILSSRFIESLS